MTDELLQSYTRQYIEAHPGGVVTFAWQGGEPTLAGLDFYRRAVQYQKQYGTPGQIQNALQTNGVLLNAEWCEFFRDEGFLVGVSLDGPRELHDRYRVDKAGAPTFDRVMTGISLLRNSNVKYNLLAAVHAANAPYPLDVYRFFRDEVRADFIQFIPIVERVDETNSQEGELVTPRSVTGAAYGAFLIAIFDEWVRRDVGRIFVQLFDVALAAWVGIPPGLCVHDDTCGRALVLEHNGDVYSCDHFVETRHKLGNLQQTDLVDLARSVQQHQFGLAKRDSLPRVCHTCSVEFACRGGCPKDRLLRTTDGEPGLNYLCDGYRAFFKHIERPMEMMAQDLRNGRAPSNVMLRLAQKDCEWQVQLAVTGRNEPCPCGSGRKFKHCHGRLTSRVP